MSVYIVHPLNLQDTSAAVLPPPTPHSAHIQVSLLVGPNTGPALAMTLSGLAFTHLLWLTLQTWSVWVQPTLCPLRCGLGIEKEDVLKDTFLALNIRCVQKRLCTVGGKKITKTFFNATMSTQFSTIKYYILQGRYTS